MKSILFFKFIKHIQYRNGEGVDVLHCEALGLAIFTLGFLLISNLKALDLKNTLSHRLQIPVPHRMSNR